jgi:hypothetical protein
MRIRLVVFPSLVFFSYSGRLSFTHPDSAPFLPYITIHVSHVVVSAIFA